MSSRHQDPRADRSDHPSVDHLLSYQQQALPRAEMERMRAHMVECRACRDLLLEAETFAPQRDPEISEDQRQAAWARWQAHRASATEQAPEPTGPEPRTPSRLAPSPQAADRRTSGPTFLQMAALVALLLGAGMLLTHQFRAQREILVAQGERLEEQSQVLATLERALEESRGETERTRRELAERSAPGSGRPPAVPGLETSIGTLDLLPGGFSRQSGADRPQQSKSVDYLFVNLHLASGSDFTAFQLQILGPDQQILQSASGLSRTPLGTVGFLLPTAGLSTGVHTLVLAGLEAGAAQEIERYEVEVLEP